MTDSDLNEPIEIRWHFAHHGALAMMYSLVSFGGLWTAYAEPGLRFLGPFWFATLIQGLVSLARAIDRRPKIILSNTGFSCPGWFVGAVAWSEVQEIGELALLGKSTPYFVLRREAADGLVWLGIDRLLRSGERRRRAPILFRIGEMDMDAERFSSMVKAHVAARRDGDARAARTAASELATTQIAFSPLYAREFALSWLAVPASLLLGPPPFMIPFIWFLIVMLVFLTIAPELLPLGRNES